jgi:hypothetical protein
MFTSINPFVLTGKPKAPQPHFASGLPPVQPTTSQSLPQLQTGPHQDTFQKSQQPVRFGSRPAPGGSDEGDPDPNRYPFNLHLPAEATGDEPLPPIGTL